MIFIVSTIPCDLTLLHNGKTAHNITGGSIQQTQITQYREYLSIRLPSHRETHSRDFYHTEGSILQTTHYTEGFIQQTLIIQTDLSYRPPITQRDPLAGSLRTEGFTNESKINMFHLENFYHTQKPTLQTSILQRDLSNKLPILQRDLSNKLTTIQSGLSYHTQRSIRQDLLCWLPKEVKGI